jgi:hypothetical protein
MPINYGSNAGRGFSYQYAYACRRIVEHFQHGTFISATLEGHEDIDLEYRENKNVITEFIQVKTREEGRQNWTVREFTSLVLAPFLARKTHEKEFSIFHFVTDGIPDAGLKKLRGEIIPALRENLSVQSQWQGMVEEMYTLAQTQLQKKKFVLNRDDFFKVLSRVKITTEYPDLKAICDHAQSVIAQFEIRKDKVHDAYNSLSREITRIAGLKRHEERRLIRSDVAALLGIPSASRGTLENIHLFKDPAQAWYVHRHEETDFNDYLKSIASGWTENKLITGESGIGKSSFLNNARIEAEKQDIKVVKLLVYEPNYDNFLLQLGDEINKTLKIKADPLEKNPRNRLLSLLTDYREKSNKPVLLMIDQFERLFEESSVRIDESRMKQVWRQFISLCKEINGLLHISFILTSRQHFYWIMFPSLKYLKEDKFSYLFLGKFDHVEAEALLDNLLAYSGKDMTNEAKKLLLEKAENEPQIISLSFVNIFSEREHRSPVDVAELLETQPWNNIFRQDVETICKNQLQKLVVFAMANIGRELCDIDEILERVTVVGKYSPAEIRDTLFEIQKNTHSLLKQPVDGKFSFYHRKLGEFVSHNYKSEFPAEWVDEGVVWDVQKMIKDEVRVSKNLETLISPEKMRIINNYREQLKLDPEELLLIARSSLLDDLNPEYWVQQSLKANPATIAGITFFLDHANQEVRIRAVGMLNEYSDEQSLATIERSINLNLEKSTLKQAEKQLSGTSKLIDIVLSLFEKRNYMPETSERKIYWIRIALLRSNNFSYWLQCDTRDIQKALDFILSDLQKEATLQINGSVLTNIILTLEKIQDKKAQNIFFDFFEQFLDQYLEEKNNYYSEVQEIFKKLASNLSKAMVNGMNMWMERLHTLSPKETVAKIGLHTDFFSEYAHNDFLPYAEAFTQKINMIRLQLNTEFIERSIKISLLNKMAFFFESVNNIELSIEAYSELLTELLESKELDQLTEAIDIAIKLEDHQIFTRVIELLETENIIKNDEDLSIIKKIARVLEDFDSTIDKQFIVTPVWNLTVKVLDLQDSDTFPAPIHAPFLSLFSTCILNYNFTDPAILTDLFYRVQESKGNVLLKQDMLGIILLRKAELEYEIHEEDLLLVYNWFKKNIQKISDSLILTNEELKGDILFNFHQLTSLCNKNSRKLLERSCAAYLHALQFYSRMDENEFYFRTPICAAKAIIIKAVHQHSTDWQTIIDDLSAWDLRIAGRIILHEGHREIFHVLAERLFLSNDEFDDEIKDLGAKDWIDDAWNHKEYKLFIQCLNNLSSDSQYDYCKYTLPEYLGGAIDPLHDADFLEALTRLELKNTYILIHLADVFYKKRERAMFIQFAILFFKSEKNKESKTQVANKWAERAIELKNKKLIKFIQKYKIVDPG